MWLINKTTSPITIDSYNLTIPGRSQADIGGFAIDSKYLAGLEYAESASTDKTLKTCISEIDSEPAKLDVTMLANKSTGAIRDLVRLNNGDLLALSNYFCDYYRSTDNGNTWSKEQVIVDSSVVQVRAKHLRYIDGTIFITVDGGAAYRKKVLKSTDNGHTWEVQSVATGDTVNSYYIIDIMKHPDGHWAVAGTYEGKTYCSISDSIEGTSCVTFTSAMTYSKSCLLTVAGVYTALITEMYIEAINNTTGEKFKEFQYNNNSNYTPYIFNVDGNYLLTNNRYTDRGYVITQYTESDDTGVFLTTNFYLQYTAGGYENTHISPFGVLTLPDGKLLWYGRSDNSRKLNFTLTDKFTVGEAGSNVYIYAKASTDTAEPLSQGSIDTAVGYIDDAGKPVVIFGFTGEDESEAATATFVPEKVNGVEVYPSISLAIGTRLLLQYEEYGDIRDEIIVVSDYTTIQDKIHNYTGKYAKRIVSVRVLSAEL
jgi:hypothetical protein